MTAGPEQPIQTTADSSIKAQTPPASIQCNSGQLHRVLCVCFVCLPGHSLLGAVHTTDGPPNQPSTKPTNQPKQCNPLSDKQGKPNQATAHCAPAALPVTGLGGGSKLARMQHAFALHRGHACGCLEALCMQPTSRHTPPCGQLELLVMRTYVQMYTLAIGTHPTDTHSYRAYRDTYESVQQNL